LTKNLICYSILIEKIHLFLQVICFLAGVKEEVEISSQPFSFLLFPTKKNIKSL